MQQLKTGFVVWGHIVILLEIQSHKVLCYVIMN